MKGHRMPQSHDIHPNVVPLIDIVMCLIIFYMLVAKIGVNTGADNTLSLPPSLIGIKLKDMGNTVTLNVLKPTDNSDLPKVTTLDPAAGRTIPVAVLDMSRTPPSRPLTQFLNLLKGQNQEFKVIIRADKDTDYRYIEPVLICCAEAKVKNVNFATAIETVRVAR